MAAAAEGGRRRGRARRAGGRPEARRRDGRCTSSSTSCSPPSRWSASPRSSRRAHPDVELVLFTEILSGVTAHVREKRSTWGIAIEDADLSDLDSRAIADVRLIPVAARTHPLALREGPIEARRPGRDRADRARRAPSRHGSGARGPRRLLAAGPGAWSISRPSTRSSPAGSAGGTCPSTSSATSSASGRLVALRLDAWGGVAPRQIAASSCGAAGRDGPGRRAGRSIALSELCRRKVRWNQGPHHARVMTSHHPADSVPASPGDYTL